MSAQCVCVCVIISVRLQTALKLKSDKFDFIFKNITMITIYLAGETHASCTEM